MKETITVNIPKSLRKELDSISAREGVSRSEVVRESLRDYVFVRRFRSLRQRMTAKAARQGIKTDEDVFRRVS